MSFWLIINTLRCMATFFMLVNGCCMMLVNVNFVSFTAYSSLLNHCFIAKCNTTASIFLGLLLSHSFQILAGYHFENSTAVASE